MKRRIEAPAAGREEFHRIAEEAYIYGYPLVLMHITQRIHTAVPSPTFRSAPLNQFAHSRFFPMPHDKDVVRPHADSLSSSAWLDLSNDPIVLSIPPTDQYYLLLISSCRHELLAALSPRHQTFVGGHLTLTGR